MFKNARLSALYITIIIGFAFIILLSFFSGNKITGYAVNERIILQENELTGDEQFKVIEVVKDSNSMLNLNVQSEFNSNIFVEINDCGYWKAGKDKDNIILYSINNIKEGNFNVGDPSLNTIQQIELYKSNYLCLIIINKGYSNNNGKFNVQIEQLDKDKWTIV